MIIFNKDGFGIEEGVVTHAQRILNFHAWQNALTKAARGGILKVPPSYIEMCVPEDAVIPIAVHGEHYPDLANPIRGAYLPRGSRITIIGSGSLKVFPDGAPYPFTPLDIGPGSRVRLEDLTIDGPDFGYRSNGDDYHHCRGPSWGVRYFGATYDSSAPHLHPKGSLSCRNVTVGGKFLTAIGCHGGAVDVRLDGCTLSAHGIGLAVFSNNGVVRSVDLWKTTIENTAFVPAGFRRCSEAEISDVIGHAVYVHPNVALRARDCVFRNSKGSVKHFTGGEISEGATSEFVRCRFEDIEEGVLGTARGTTLLKDPVLIRTKVRAGASLEVRGGTMIQAHGFGWYDADELLPHRHITVEGMRIVDTVGFLITANRDDEVADFLDCTISINHADDFAAGAFITNHETEADIGFTDSVITVHRAVVMAYHNAGRFRFVRTTLRGDPDEYWLRECGGETVTTDVVLESSKEFEGPCP